MKKLLLTLAAVCLFAVPALAQNEADSIPASEVKALAKQYNDAIKEARVLLREKNSALALALAKTDDYKEEAVIDCHRELKEAQRDLADAELRALLFYKNTHPSWKPEANGNKVRVPNLNKNPEENAKDREAKRKKRKEAKAGKDKPAEAPDEND